MADVVFVGNGINRAYQGDSWQNIVERVMDAYKPPYTYDEIKSLPFSMQIVAASNDNVDKAMKDIVAKSLIDCDISKDQQNFLQSILCLPSSNIITTNYSFELEQAAGIPKKCSEYKKRRQYAFNTPSKTRRPRMDRYYDVKEYGKKIWHIHGDACQPSGIIMGHYYYEKLIREIEDYIPKLIRRHAAFTRHERDYVYQSWVDSFLIDNVYMFGFGMDFSESDLWWLLCCKKRNFPASKVFIYQPSQDLSDSQRIMLKCYHVEIVNDVKFENDYPTYYKNVLADIARRMEEQS